jgi:hypothetical protein
VPAVNPVTGVTTPNVLSAAAAQPKVAATPPPATFTNLSAGRHAAPTVNSRTPEVKLPTLATSPAKPSATFKPSTSATNPLSPKNLADNVSHALGIKKDRPKDASSGDDAS